MPKIVSENDRRATKELIYKEAVQLIKEKGLSAVTVEDITKAVEIGKGSLYLYYPSKEVCLFEVVRRYEKELFQKLQEIMILDIDEKAKAVALLKELYTSKDSLISSIKPLDLEQLILKLPSEYQELSKKKEEDNFQAALSLLKIEKEDMEVVAALTDCLSHISSSSSYSLDGKQQALNILISTIADFVVIKKGRGSNGENQKN